MNQVDKYISQALARLEELQKIITNLILKIDSGEVDWTSLIQTYNLVNSMTVSTIRSFLNLGFPFLSNISIIPTTLSTNQDDKLFNLTKGRILMLTEDIIPNLLKTKMNPELEQLLLEEKQKVESSNESFKNEIAKMASKAETIYNIINSITGEPQHENIQSKISQAERKISHSSDSKMKYLLNFMQYSKDDNY